MRLLERQSDQQTLLRRLGSAQLVQHPPVLSSHCHRCCCGPDEDVWRGPAVIGEGSSQLKEAYNFKCLKTTLSKKWKLYSRRVHQDHKRDSSDGKTGQDISSRTIRFASYRQRRSVVVLVLNTACYTSQELKVSDFVRNTITSGPPRAQVSLCRPGNPARHSGTVLQRYLGEGSTQVTLACKHKAVTAIVVPHRTCSQPLKTGLSGETCYQDVLVDEWYRWTDLTAIQLVPFKRYINE
ncbi:uncharacterized protein LOC112562504 [Pomacea canaliculata]|uniref:uncharacterized protein LOC112562504 n=1 Tax=Pomacea canaliculata TaxID=400727 RepID=UPI000D73EF2D|nr:uncharacterized protein LOC112562504 [Pomacea canaliculata]